MDARAIAIRPSKYDDDQKRAVQFDVSHRSYKTGTVVNNRATQIGVNMFMAIVAILCVGAIVAKMPGRLISYRSCTRNCHARRLT